MRAGLKRLEVSTPRCREPRVLKGRTYLRPPLAGAYGPGGRDTGETRSYSHVPGIFPRGFPPSYQYGPRRRVSWTRSGRTGHPLTEIGHPDPLEDVGVVHACSPP